MSETGSLKEGNDVGCCQSIFAKRILLWYILLGCIITVPLSWEVIMGCRLVLVGTPGDSRKMLDGFGIFHRAIYDDYDGSFLGCVQYSNQWSHLKQDKGFKIAGAFGVLLAIFITVASFICVLVQCFNKHGKTRLWGIMKWSYAFGFVSQIFTFCISISDICKTYEGGDSDCAIGSSGIVGIFNVLFLLGMVLATFNSLPPRNPVFRCWTAVPTEMQEYGWTDEDSEELDTENPKATKKTTAPRTPVSYQDEADDVFEKVPRNFRSSHVRSSNESVSLFGEQSFGSKKQRSVRSKASSIRSKPSSANPKSRDSISKDRSTQDVSRNRSSQAASPSDSVGSGANTKHASSVKQSSIRTDESSPANQKSVSSENKQNSSVLVKQNSIRTEGSAAATQKSVSSENKQSSSVSQKTLPRENQQASPVNQNFITRENKQASPVNQNSITRDTVQSLKSVKSSPTAQSLKSVKKENKIHTSSSAVSAERSLVKDESSTIGSLNSRSITSQNRIKESPIVKTPARKRAEFYNSKDEQESRQSSRRVTTPKSFRSHKSGHSVVSAASSNYSNFTESKVLEVLGQSVELGPGGIRISETRVGNRLEIIDQYPAMSRDGKKMTSGPEGTDIIKIRSEYCDIGRKTIKEEIHQDGSRTVTTLVDPITMDDSVAVGRG